MTGSLRFRKEETGLGTFEAIWDAVKSWILDLVVGRSDFVAFWNGVDPYGAAAALGRGVRSLRVSGASVREGEPSKLPPPPKKSVESARRRSSLESAGIWKENDASERSGRWRRLSSELVMAEETGVLEGNSDGQMWRRSIRTFKSVFRPPAPVDVVVADKRSAFVNLDVRTRCVNITWSFT